MLQHVIDRATARDDIEQEIKRSGVCVPRGLHLALPTPSADAYSPVRALRALKHDRLQQRLFCLDKDARLRSGTRGLQARKTLVAFEKVVAESSALCVQASP